MSEYSTGELLREIDRELKQRGRVYPRLVATKKLSQRTADEQIAKLVAIRAIIAALDDAERLL